MKPLPLKKALDRTAKHLDELVVTEQGIKPWAELTSAGPERLVVIRSNAESHREFQQRMGLRLAQLSFRAARVRMARAYACVEDCLGLIRVIARGLRRDVPSELIVEMDGHERHRGFTWELLEKVSQELPGISIRLLFDSPSLSTRPA